MRWLNILVILLTLFLFYGCTSGPKNKVPYKYRTEAQVKMECEAEIAKNAQSRANAGSDAGNFALGFIEAMMEDWACDPLK
ncbi:hypothetical protein N8868_03200 [Candidatus Pelagibacter ubique]|jgi:hypothetical protein|nr:hypothetical protein [Candidatus Pelagibacter ubique]